MKELLAKDQSHLMWKDELEDVFILLKYAEIYRYSKKMLRLYVWSKKKLSSLRKLGVILNESETDDPLYIVDIKTEYLPQLIKLGTFHRRPYKNGKWIKKKEQLLGHRILSCK